MRTSAREIDGLHPRGRRVVRRQGARRPARRAPPLAPCPTPGCEGQIVEYPKSYGCNTLQGQGRARAAATRSGSSERPHAHARARRSSTSPPGAPARTSRAEREVHRPLPHARVRRRDHRAHPQLRLHELEEPHRDRLRVRHLEAACAARRARSTSRPPARWWPRGETNAAPAAVEGAHRRLPHARLRRRDRREQPCLRLHELEEPQEPRLRLRHLEAREGHEVTREEADRAHRGGARAGSRDTGGAQRPPRNDPRRDRRSRPRRALDLAATRGRRGPAASVATTPRHAPSSP